MHEHTSATLAPGGDTHRALSLNDVDECSRLLDRLNWLVTVANFAATEIEDTVGPKPSKRILHALYLLAEDTQSVTKELKTIIHPDWDLQTARGE